MIKIIKQELEIKKYGAEPRSNKNKAVSYNPILLEGKENNEKEMKVDIEFDIPAKYHGENVESISVSIIGNFTEWIPFQMEKVKGIDYRYKYTGFLKRGYKHRYQFIVNGEEYIDENKKSSIKFNGSKTNYLMIPLLSLESLHSGDLSSFMCQDKDSPSLLNYPSYVPSEMAKVWSKESYHESESGENKNLGKYVFENLKSCEEINQRKKYLEEKILETELEKDRVIYRSQYKQLDSEFCKIGLALK